MIDTTMVFKAYLSRDVYIISNESRPVGSAAPHSTGLEPARNLLL